MHLRRRTLPDLDLQTIELGPPPPRPSFGPPSSAPPASQTAPTTFTFEQWDSEHLVLQGELDGRKLAVRFTRKGKDDFQLLGRGYRWVSEFPFNR
ncbi:MAG: hypothetical protein U1E76_27035 [Planctomycetota bacterium]